MAHLAFPVSCASMGQLLMVQHCPLCLNVALARLWLPTRPHHPPPIDSICDITAIEKKLPQKQGA